jgi:hypothetical protein
MALSAQNIVLPADFDWRKFPSSYQGETLEIRHHFTPANADIRLPESVTLMFKGGSITAFKSLHGNQTSIIAPKTKIFDAKAPITGTFINTTATPEWFGAKGDLKTNDGEAVSAAIGAFPVVSFSGKYHIPGINIIIRKPCELIGQTGALIRGDGNSSGRFTIKSSIVVRNLQFEQFRFCFFFDHDAPIDGIRFVNNRFSGIEKPLYASNANLKQKLMHIEITDNHFSKCTSGVELLGWVKYVTLCRNEFLDLGSPTLQQQSNAIRLGNTAFNAHTDTAMGDYTICGNVIKNVFCGQNQEGAEGFECHAVFVTGTRVAIKDNLIENVYNGGIKGQPRIKTGSEGIYVKANDCIISGNTLINAGFGEGAISVKGFNTGVQITNNVLRYTADLADFPQLITCYYAGKLLIEKNKLESVATNSTGLKLCASGNAPTEAVVSGNQQWKINGYGFKILNKAPGASVIIENNSGMLISGHLLKEESTQSYTLLFKRNILTITDGGFLPSTKMNELTLINNTIVAKGKPFAAHLFNQANVQKNSFEIHSASNHALFVMNDQSSFSQNTILMKSAWKTILMFSNTVSGQISENNFMLSAKEGKIERVVFINSSTPGLSVALEKNLFRGSDAQKSAILITVSNAGLKHLGLVNNTADDKTGVFLEVLSGVDNAEFQNNKTSGSGGFAAPASLKRITVWQARSNTQLPNKTSSGN